MQKYPDILPLSKYWDEIVKIIGDESAYNNLRRVYEDKGAMFYFDIQESSITFESFIPDVIKGQSQRILIPGNRSSLREFTESNNILNYIKSNDELSDILISHLILKDLFYWYMGYKDNVDPSMWNSEKVAAFLEDREVNDNPIFNNRRYGEFFPRYAEIKYSFTGLFLDKYVWEEPKSVPKRTIGSLKDGIRITLDR